MKHRSGFVSNSSTCSFIICGFVVPGSGSKGGYKNARRDYLQKIHGLTDEDIKTKMRENSWYKTRPEKVDDPAEILEFCDELFYEYEGKGDIGVIDGEGSPDGGMVIGEVIHHGSSDDYDGLPTCEIDVEELTKRVIPMREKMGCPDAPIKLYAGTLSC